MQPLLFGQGDGDNLVSIDPAQHGLAGMGFLEAHEMGQLIFWSLANCKDSVLRKRAVQDGATTITSGVGELQTGADESAGPIGRNSSSFRPWDFLQR
jgi:X-X-X-Leu-X-X-Gly heptad repeat protein